MRCENYSKVKLTRNKSTSKHFYFVENRRVFDKFAVLLKTNFFNGCFTKSKLMSHKVLDK